MKKIGLIMKLVVVVALAAIGVAGVFGGKFPKCLKVVTNVLKGDTTIFEGETVPLSDEASEVNSYIHDVTILGEVHSNAETELYFNDRTIEDLNQFIIDLGQFFQLEKCEMCNTNLTNEQMDALGQIYPDTKFVWIVHCAQWSIRTDAVSFSTMFVDYGWGPETSEDFEPLKYCTDLEALDIGHKSCTDISFLKDLKKLKILIIAINRITDITPLEGLTNLTYLELFLNDIQDLSPLEKLVNLEYLNLCHNRNIGDIDPILHYTNLKRLWISNCNLTTDEINLIKATYPNTWLEFNVYESVQAGWRDGTVYYPMRNAFNNGVIDPMFYPKVYVEEETDTSQSETSSE